MLWGIEMHACSWTREVLLRSSRLWVFPWVWMLSRPGMPARGTGGRFRTCLEVRGESPRLTRRESPVLSRWQRMRGDRHRVTPVPSRELEAGVRHYLRVVVVVAMDYMTRARRGVPRIRLILVY